MSEKKSRRRLTHNEISCALNLKRIYNAKKKELGLTHEGVAHKAGWQSASTASHYINQKIPLNTEAKLKFAKILQVDVTEIDPEFKNHYSLPDEQPTHQVGEYEAMAKSEEYRELGKVLDELKALIPEDEFYAQMSKWLADDSLKKVNK